MSHPHWLKSSLSLPPSSTCHPWRAFLSEFFDLSFYFHPLFLVFFLSFLSMYSDDLDSVTNNLRDSAKGSNDGYDVAFPLTIGELAGVSPLFRLLDPGLRKSVAVVMPTTLPLMRISPPKKEVRSRGRWASARVHERIVALIRVLIWIWTMVMRLSPERIVLTESRPRDCDVVSAHHYPLNLT